MVHYVITRDFSNTAEREEFINSFEEVLTTLGIELQTTNQSTYFGEYVGESWRPQDFINELVDELENLVWKRDDVVTVYYPKAKEIGGKYRPDIGVHFLKNKGSNKLNRM